MRRTLLGCCAGCINMARNSSDHCNNKYSDRLNCKGCRLHTKSLPMGTTTLGGCRPDCTVTCRCLQDVTEQEIQNHICKYRRSK